MLLNRGRLQAILEQQDLRAVVVSLPHNVYYCSDFDTPFSSVFANLAAVVIPRDPTLSLALLVPDTEIRRGSLQSRVAQVLSYSAIETANTRHLAALNSGELIYDTGSNGAPTDLVTALAGYLQSVDLDIGRIGFDQLDLGLQLIQTAELARLVPIGAVNLLRRVRMVKTADELALMRTAARKNELAQLVSIEAIAAGATYGEAQRVYASSLLQMGGQAQYMLGQVARPGTAIIADLDKPIQPADTVFFDSLGGYRHYKGDIGRTAIVGPPKVEQLKAFRALRRGWAEAINSVRPGLDSRELAAIIMRTVRAAGADDYITCNPHCVGLEHTDQPQLHTFFEPFVLEAGMVINVDMPYKALEVGMLHTEDTIHVTETGVEFLTSNDDRLFMLENGSVSRLD